MASMKLLGESWRVEEDHAKWAVTVDKRWICIGDINREVLIMPCWLYIETVVMFVHVLL